MPDISKPVDNRYYEHEISLSEFLSVVNLHEKENFQYSFVGEKIWRHIKSKILEKHPEKELSRKGITLAYKKRLYSLCDSMTELLEGACDLDRSSFINRMSVLQETAIILGESIEEKLGQGTAVVGVLEDLCEKAYGVSELFLDLNIQEEINNIEIFIKNIGAEIEKIPYKLNIFFLPYKYSMWDSLESVWRAAFNDEVVEARVVPIPYYDLSTGENHYELEDFLGNIPVELCKDIDFSEEYPDGIFIHNPYDDANYVTSVFPEYYAKELKKYTDELVYIPYFVFNSEVIGAINAQVPGVYYADHVILQSTSIRDTFKNHHRNLLEEMEEPIDEDYQEEKFLDFGSPKFDRFINELEKKRDLPSDWNSKIYSKGGRKKVLFIDTNVMFGMAGTIDYTKVKFPSILDYMEKHEEVVFIWRPHPLTEAAIKTSNPEFIDTFKGYKKRAMEIANCIFDDNKDAYMGLAVSDGYYGNGYSLSGMYIYSNRPQLYADWSVETK